ncbi:P-loop NTPase fold protein [Chitinophaga sp. RAB17]|uniref:P-loop NTPase fold protein n=1 Tax=Chitinophaga sp. RAB17 TaxID=3233049 RepID=UPI003F935820
MDYPTIPVLNVAHEFGRDISPFLADLVVLPIDSSGSAGQLNTEVLQNLRYTSDVFPTEEELINGYHYYKRDEDGINVLFVVTVGDGKTSNLLRNNLRTALREVSLRGNDQTIWIPLMGTGAGRLTFEESLSITVAAINDANEAYELVAYFYISLPDSVDENLLEQQMKSNSRVATKDKITSAQIFVDNLKVNAYVFNPKWAENSKLDQLIQNDSWSKNDNSSPLSKLMEAVNIGDIVFYNMAHKSYYSTLKEEEDNFTLELTAIGVAITISGEQRMKIDWRIANVNVAVTTHLPYSGILQQAEKKDVIKILRHFSPVDWAKIGDVTLPISGVGANVLISRIGHFHSDIDTATDHLDISQDVGAFARIIAARSFQPPLAIALLGKWGSGKSFFMEQLKRKIEELSKSSMEDAYCAGIAQIHFNAWSYMDTNLWASIISRIFEQLNIYIQADDSKEGAKKEIRQILTKSLNITKEEITFLESRKGQIDSQIEVLKSKEKRLRIDLAKKIQAVRRKTIKSVIANVDQQFHVKKRIIKSLNENRSFGKSKKELRQIVPEEYWNNPEEAYKQAKSTYSFLRTFFRKGKILSNTLWLFFIVFLIIAIPMGLHWLEQQISITGFLIPPFVITFLSSAAVMFVRVMAVYKELRPVIASFWKIKVDYEKEIEEAIDKMKQDEKALELEIEKGRAELIIINEQMESAKIIQADLDFRISNALATETLYNFIDTRSKSEDYRKHLGIISIIRKDLEILNGLFYDHQGEVKANGEAEIFRSHFKVKLQRIVLYIDDLDRCPEDLVVQVLEAVNLLMAFPLFVVVVGVDSRWIKNALIKRHALQFGGVRDQLNENLEYLEPADYLEKIFQIPFHLKEPNDTAVKSMIRKLANTNTPFVTTKVDTKSVKSDRVKDPEKHMENHIVVQPRRVGKGTFWTQERIQAEIAGMNSKSGMANDNHQTELKEQIEILVLTEKEVEIMQQMSEFVGNNPRTVKRFVNIFRIIKAHEAFNYKNEDNTQEVTAILFMLSLSLGPFKRLVPYFVENFSKATGDIRNLHQFFRKNNTTVNIEALNRQLEQRILGNRSFKLDLGVGGEFVKHYDFIKRFTFKDI